MNLSNGEFILVLPSTSMPEVIEDAAIDAATARSMASVRSLATSTRSIVSTATATFVGNPAILRLCRDHRRLAYSGERQLSRRLLLPAALSDRRCDR